MSEFGGAARNAAGRAQDAVGETAGDAKTRAEGLYNQAAGEAQQQIVRLGDVIKGQPIVSVLVALGIVLPTGSADALKRSVRRSGGGNSPAVVEA